MDRISALEHVTGIPAAVWQALRDDPDRERRRIEPNMAMPSGANNIPISLRAAARKYDIPPMTLSGYAKNGYVLVIDRPEKKGLPIVLDEGTVASVAVLYHTDAGRGRNPLKTTRKLARAVDRATAAFAS